MILVTDVKLKTARFMAVIAELDAIPLLSFKSTSLVPYRSRLPAKKCEIDEMDSRGGFGTEIVRSGGFSR